MITITTPAQALEVGHTLKAYDVIKVVDDNDTREALDVAVQHQNNSEELNVEYYADYAVVGKTTVIDRILKETKQATVKILS